MGFDRLIKSLDNNKNIKNFKFLVQIGGNYKPKILNILIIANQQITLKYKSNLIITHGGIKYNVFNLFE